MANDKWKMIRYYAAPTVVNSFQNQRKIQMMKNHFLTSTGRRFAPLLMIAIVVAVCGSAVAQQFSPDLFRSLHWRSIGPFRGGRTRAVAGGPSQQNVFYIAQVNGGN